MSDTITQYFYYITAKMCAIYIALKKRPCRKPKQHYFFPQWKVNFILGFTVHIPSRKVQSHFQSLRGFQMSWSWNMPGISLVFTEATMSRYPRYCEKSLFSKCDIEKNHLAWEPAQCITWNNGQWPSQVHATWMGNPSPEIPTFLTVPHPRGQIFCSTVLGSSLPFVIKLLQGKQIVRTYVKPVWERPSPYYKILQGETHMLYIMEIIIIALKLQLIAVFQLHSGRRVFYVERTQNLTVKLKYSRVF